MLASQCQVKLSFFFFFLPFFCEEVISIKKGFDSLWILTCLWRLSIIKFWEFHTFNALLEMMWDAKAYFSWLDLLVTWWFPWFFFVAFFQK